MITVTLYRRSNCPECDRVAAELDDLRNEIPHQVVTIDLDHDPELLKILGAQAPVVEMGPYRLQSPFSKQDLKATLGAAFDRQRHLVQAGDEQYRARVERGLKMTSSDRISQWLSNHYMLVFNLIIFLYVGVPFLAPVLMKVGANLPAQGIYKAYSILCHQFAFRSWFLFGEQPAYPRELAHVPGLIPYGQATGLDENDIIAARAFDGTSLLGYKVAICERDVAIYGGILLFGLLFSLTGRRFKSLPFLAWVIVGILPIALDGFSQMTGLLSFLPLKGLPIRESTPLLRTLTGAIFGISTGWYGYPYVEESMCETRRLLAKKIAVIQHHRLEEEMKS